MCPETGWKRLIIYSKLNRPIVNLYRVTLKETLFSQLGSTRLTKFCRSFSEPFQKSPVLTMNYIQRTTTIPDAIITRGGQFFNQVSTLANQSLLRVTLFTSRLRQKNVIRSV